MESGEKLGFGFDDGFWQYVPSCVRLFDFPEFCEKVVEEDKTRGNGCVFFS